MYVCIFKGITDSQIRSAVHQGAQSVRDLYRDQALGSQCGKCVCTARSVLECEKQSLSNCEIVAA